MENWDSLWALLVQITIRKCCRKAEHFTAARRDVRGEREPPSDESAWDMISREPTPAEAFVLAETIEELMQPMDGRGREIVSLSLQGFLTQKTLVNLSLTPNYITSTSINTPIYGTLMSSLDITFLNNRIFRKNPVVVSAMAGYPVYKKENIVPLYKIYYMLGIGIMF